MTTANLEGLLWHALDSATAECARLGYSPTRFKSMLAEHGPVEACTRLVLSPQINDGLAKLCLLGRLDLSVEAIIQRPEFAPLFEPRVLLRARARVLTPAQGPAFAKAQKKKMH